MTWPPRPTLPHEDDDPTGVRALLAGLPDPGPMPDDVAARVLARLADAQADDGGPGRRGPAGSSHGPGSPEVEPAAGRDESGDGAAPPAYADEEVDLASVLPFEPVTETQRDTRRRQPRWLALGAAAAMLVVVLVGAGAVFRGLIGQSPTSASVQEGASAGSKAVPLQADAGQVVGGQRVHFQMSGRDYSEAALAREAQDILQTPAAALELPLSDADRIGSVATPEGLASCITTLGEADADQIAVDMATYAGQSAAIVVVRKAGIKHVLAVAPTCSQGDPQILVGPLPMT